MSKFFTKSFYDWCIENNRQDVLDRWDYELNKFNPKNIGYATRKKCWVKCPKGIHPSELKNICSFIKGVEGSIKCSACDSFGQYLINMYGDKALDLYWDYKKNDINPFSISKNHGRKVWIKCIKTNYHVSYLGKPSEFVGGHRCPYCAGKKVDKFDSLAYYHIHNTDINFLEKYWDYDKNKNIDPWDLMKNSNKIVWIKCQEKDYHGSYQVMCNEFTNGKRCNFCGNFKIHKLDSLGNLYPEVLFLWSDKNKKSPYEFSTQNNICVWWKCPDGLHKDYQRRISNTVNCNFRCPNCVRERKESFLQEKVRLYLTEEKGYKLMHEYECSIIPRNPKTKYLLPFDNEIIDLKLIIEVNGSQHYNINDGYNTAKAIRNNLTPEQQLHKRQLYDRYKKYVAFRNGYYYLEIPYWTDDSQETYKKLIDDKIKEIINILIKDNKI